MSIRLLAIFFGVLLLPLFSAPGVIAQDDGALDLQDAAALLDTDTASDPVVDGNETADDPATPASPEKPGTGTTQGKRGGAGILSLLRASGLVGFVICLLSLVAVALTVEHALTIRRTVLIPPGLAEKALELLNAGQWTQALQLCRNDPSPLGQSLAAGLAEWEIGWHGVEKGAEEAMAEQAARLYRKVEYLNVIGNIAPMLGLLGTVIGMVYAFSELADTQGFAQASDLAGGIYLALVTTVQGLVVAIPALAVYAFFCNRIASLIAETTDVASQVLLPVRKRLLRPREK